MPSQKFVENSALDFHLFVINSEAVPQIILVDELTGEPSLACCQEFGNRQSAPEKRLKFARRIRYMTQNKPFLYLDASHGIFRAVRAEEIPAVPLIFSYIRVSAASGAAVQAQATLLNFKAIFIF